MNYVAAVLALLLLYVLMRMYNRRKQGCNCGGYRCTGYDHFGTMPRSEAYTENTLAPLIKKNED